jgi:hypothetical protein
MDNPPALRLWIPRLGRFDTARRNQSALAVSSCLLEVPMEGHQQLDTAGGTQSFQRYAERIINKLRVT